MRDLLEGDVAQEGGADHKVALQHQVEQQVVGVNDQDHVEARHSARPLGPG